MIAEALTRCHIPVRVSSFCSISGYTVVTRYRDPMLLVTSVEELTPGEEIRASFYADPAREIFPGHFPGLLSVHCRRRKSLNGTPKRCSSSITSRPSS